MLASMNSNPPTRIKWELEPIPASDNLPEDPGPDPSTASLLRVGRGAWESFVMVFGDVADLATARIECRKLVVRHAWISALERIVRCLLLIMAFELALPRNPGPAPTPPVLRTRRVGERDEVEGDDCNDDGPSGDVRIDPDLWRVSLPMLCVPYDLIDVADDWHWVEPPPRTRGPHPRDGLYSTAAVARRAEAVLRILNDPAPYARRLALRLSRLWAPLTFPPPPRVRYLKPIGIDYDPEPAPPPRPGPYDHWIKPARKRCEEMAAAYWSDG